MSTPGSPPTSFASIVRTWSASHPGAPALTVLAGGGVDARWTYGELDAMSNRVANGLLAAGVTVGDRVAHLGRNRAGYVASLYGASKVRATIVGFNWRLTASELTALLVDAQPGVIIVDEEFQPTLARAAAAAGVAPRVVGGDDVERWAEAYSPEDPETVPEADDIALIFYTSGTTGVPKGAMLPVRAIAANLARPVPWRMRPGAAALVCSPVFHTAGTGWIYLPAFYGAHCVLLRDPSPRQILAAIEEQRVAQALLVPTVIRVVLDDPAMATADVSSLETLAYGAAPISPTLLRAAVETLGCDLVQAYGMTETGGPITYLEPADHDLADPGGRLGSAGRAVDGVEVAVVDPTTGVACPVGGSGEVWTRSDQQMVGYLNRPDATAHTITAEGWLRTGDTGHFDSNGYLFLTDRLSDIIVTGAENVSPVEVEHVLTSHPDIAAAAVIGVPDERWGETVRAVVVPAGGAVVDVPELLAWCREQLAGYKVPKGIDVVDELPVNPAGKVLRRVLRQPHWAGHERSVG